MVDFNVDDQYLKYLLKTLLRLLFKSYLLMYRL
jgi:hypothetical protein